MPGRMKDWSILPISMEYVDRRPIPDARFIPWETRIDGTGLEEDYR
jgi:hypothetical protein